MDIANIFHLFEEDDEEFVQIVNLYQSKKRAKRHKIFQNRDNEGTYAILIEQYLFSEEDRFVKFFRMTPGTFYFILDMIRDDLEPKVIHTTKQPIFPAQKLCIFLR